MTDKLSHEPRKEGNTNENRKISVFLGWSGEVSRNVAAVLNSELPMFLDNVETFFSPDDIGAGNRWSETLKEELMDADYGIFCITEDNLDSVWLHYEAGAMLKTDYNTKGRICAFLYDVNQEVLKSPFAEHQCVDYLSAGGNNRKKNRESIRRVVAKLNKICAKRERGLSPERFKRRFTQAYPALEKKLNGINTKKKAGEAEYASRTETWKQSSRTERTKNVNEANVPIHDDGKANTAGPYASVRSGDTEAFSPKSLEDMFHAFCLDLLTLQSSSKDTQNPVSDKSDARHILQDAVEKHHIRLLLPFFSTCLDILNSFPCVTDDGKELVAAADKNEVIRMGNKVKNLLSSTNDDTLKKKAADAVMDFLKVLKNRFGSEISWENGNYYRTEHTIFTKGRFPISLQTIRYALDAVAWYIYRDLQSS